MSMNPISELYNLKLTSLFSRQSKLGVSNLKTFAAKYGDPHHDFKSIHVAGSNGKGSVSTKIAKALENEGYKVGLYTSPHISTFRERMQINGKMIAEEEVIRFLPEEESLSFFELATLLCFRWFSYEKVDYAVIEVGLGGRLDATNIITPVLSIITSISLEHTELLGTTLEAVAFEKGGIIKPNVPVVVGPRANFYPNSLVAEGNFANYDEENSAIAKKALETLNISEDSINKGLLERPSCRFERVKPNVILDVAHNPDGIKELLRFLKGETFHLVLAMSKTKDIKKCFELLNPFALSYTLTESDNGRTLPVQELRSLLLETGYKSEQIDCFSKAEDAIKHAQKRSGLILITGTFFIMHAARKVLKVSPLESDYQDTNERFLPKSL